MVHSIFYPRKPLQLLLQQWSQFFIYALFFTVLIAPAVGRAKVPHFNHLHNKQLESIGHQWVTIQDEQGFMWFGGRQGLVRYDAYTFKPYLYRSDNPRSLSSNFIVSLAIGSEGNLWVGTRQGVNRYNIESDDFTRFSHDPNDPSSIGASIAGFNGILHDSKGNMWFGTSGGGLNRFDPETESFLSVELLIDALGSNAEKLNVVIDEVRALYEDKQGVIWMGCASSKEEVSGICAFTFKTGKIVFYPYDTLGHANSASYQTAMNFYEDYQGQLWLATLGGGLHRINRITGICDHFLHSPDDSTSVGNDEVWTVKEDQYNNLWVGTDKGGLNRLSKLGTNNKFQRYTHRPEDLSSIATNKVSSIYESRFGDLWLGYYPSGVSLLNRYSNVFRHYRHEINNRNSISNSSVRALAETEQGNLWVGTEKGLNYINRQTGDITRYRHDAADPFSRAGLPVDAVSALLIDSHGTLWIGLYRGGLSRFSVSEEGSEGGFTHYRSEPENLSSLSSDTVFSLYEDSEGILWVGTENGVNQYQPETDSFNRYLSNDKDIGLMSFEWVYSMLEDSQGNFWLGLDSGLTLMDRKAGTFQHYRHTDSERSGIGAGGVRTIHEDIYGQIWLGLNGGGLNRFDPEDVSFFKKYTVKDGLINAFVEGVLEDDQGYLWVSTSQGLSQFNPDTERFRDFTKDHGLAGNLHNYPAHIKSAKGELIFGSSEGLTVFNPKKMYKNKLVPPVVITGFQLFHKPVSIGADGSPLKKSITATKTLTLSHEQSVFSFEFSALNYSFPHMNRYAYKLEGFDREWTYPGSKRTATYTNLDPGTYVFKVIGANNEGVWNEQGAKVTINILPPWWRTWWAYSVYFLLLLLSLAWVVKYQINRLALVERIRLDKIKDSFLSCTSHELRTPLIGIISLTELVLKRESEPLSNDSRECLGMVNASAQRLSLLINDILDYSQIVDGRLKLYLDSVNIYPLTESVFTLLLPVAKPKGILLINELDEPLPEVEVDEDRVQQIMLNLVGNAIKYSDEGWIKVSAQKVGAMLEVTVEDTGWGIPENQQQEVFESFHQLTLSEGRTAEGTGLGLSITKQLVEMHGGRLWLTSAVGKGSRFMFTLPLFISTPEVTYNRIA